MFEYYCKYINTDDIFAVSADELNELGKEDWELVSVYNKIAYFKRFKKQ